jgi:hypothetical protein
VVDLGLQQGGLSALPSAVTASSAAFFDFAASVVAFSAAARLSVRFCWARSASWLATAAAWLRSRYLVISAEFGTAGAVGVLPVEVVGVDEDDDDGGVVVVVPPVAGGVVVVVVVGTVVVGFGVVVVVTGGGVVVVVTGGGAAVVVVVGAVEDGSGWATDAGAPLVSTTATTTTTTKPRM